MLIDRNQCVPERWGGEWGARSIKLRNRQGRRLVRMVYKTIVYIRNP